MQRTNSDGSFLIMIAPPLFSLRDSASRYCTYALPVYILVTRLPVQNLGNTGLRKREQTIQEHLQNLYEAVKMHKMFDASKDFADFIGNRKFTTILADPPWQKMQNPGSHYLH